MARGVALASVLAAAALLRFTALDWGLRHTPHIDERYFVDNVALMLAEGDLDHRFYEYPGFFFYLLYPVLALLRTGNPPGADAYLASRAVVAGLGVAGVGLLYLVGRRLTGHRAALAAAAFSAVSPLSVRTAHMVRPDVALECFGLLAILALFSVGRRVRGDLAAGAAIGAASAVKFSGVLLLPSYLVRRALADGGLRAGQALVAGVAAALVFACLSPYALLRLPDFVDGVRTQVTYHYQEKPGGAIAYGEMARIYAEAWPMALGPLGLALAAAGLFLVRRQWRAWLPLVVYPLVTLAVFATSEYRFLRHMIPSLGVLMLLAGVALDAVLARLPRPAGALAAAVALAVPALSSAAYVSEISRPGTRDQVLGWLEANVAPGARVLTTVEDLGLDPARFEVLRVPKLQRHNRLPALHADYVLTTRQDEPRALAGLATIRTVEPEGRSSGPRVRVAVVSRGCRPIYEDVPLRGARVSASENDALVEALRDGDVTTPWGTASGQQPGAWIEVAFAEPVSLARIELELGDNAKNAAKRLRVLVADGGPLQGVPALPGRPPVAEQLMRDGAPSQVLLLEPTRARRVRIEQVGRGVRRWSVGELRLGARGPLPTRCGG